MDADQYRVAQNYAFMAKIARDEPSGIPAMEPEADLPELAPYYEQLRTLLDELSTGFPKASDIALPEGAELRMIKTLFLPEHVRLAVHVPAHDFAEVDEIAAQAGMSSMDARTMLLEMARRGCIFHKKENEKDFFRLMGQIPGVVEFQPWRLSMEYMDAVGPYAKGFLRPAMFDTGLPSWRWIPLNAESVAENSILPYDNAEAILLGAERVAVCSCMCRAVQKTPCKYAEPPYELCLQLNEFADFYVNDLKISRYINHDEIRSILRHNAEHHIAMEVAGSKDAEIICSCCEDCCEPMKIYRKFGGNAVPKLTNYVLDINQSLCIGCGLCAEHCFTGLALKMNDGSPVYQQDKCVGCGVCVRSCPENALILKLKNPEDLFDPPQTLYDLYEAQATWRNKASN